MAETQKTRPASAATVYAVLRSRFSGAHYAAGDKLAEQAIAAELNVSRTPVREAIGRLLADGLVTPAARGVVVAALDAKECQDLFAVRGSLEGLAAATAAERQAAGLLAPVVLANLREASEAVRAAATKGERREAARANSHLHMEIARAADNQLLLEALTRVWDRIAVATVTHLDDDAWLAQISAQHDEVIDAIAAGDPDTARTAMAQHIADAASTHR
ncbi:GntR family transcriptional regulator [Pimelobacter simplex]|uniref:GntR family transcriptional regulator n=1 Tax=Nocardioides simplex TaxID=2045 RepID=UPI0013757AC8|nr:GntR family transcriptional regulator [Pimelobacter simplex]